MFYKFRCAVARFMYGRNGMDQMNQDKRVDELIRLLDEGTVQGVGHVNVACAPDGDPDIKIQTGCADCSAVPLACSVPTLHEGLDRKE